MDGALANAKAQKPLSAREVEAAKAADVRRSMRAEPSRIDTLLAEARAMRARGDHAAALPTLRAALSFRPRNVGILADLAVSLWGLRRLPEAEAALRHVLKLNPRHAVVLAILGRLARHNGDHEAALALFLQSLAERPGDVGLREEIGRLLIQLNRPEAAAAVWRELLAEAPESARFLRPYAQVLRAQGDAEAALALFRRALAQTPEDRGLREEIGRTLMRLNRWGEATALWQEMMREVPDDTRILLHFAQSRRGEGDHVAAAALARDAIAIQPSAQAYVTLGAALMRDLMLQEAAEVAFLAAVEHDPAHAPALHQLGMLARSRVDDDAALAWFRRAAAAAPRDPSMLFEVAVSLADLQRQAEADAALAAVEAMPEAATHERLRLRRLDQCCKSMRLDDALACLRAFGAIEHLPSGAVPVAAGLLAARGDWDDVLEVFAIRVVPGTGARLVPATDILTEAVARAARARGRQREVLGLMEGWAAAGTPVAANLRDQLAEELLLLHRVWPGMPAPAELPTSPLRVERSVRMAAALAASGPPVGVTVLLCSDLNYLPGTVVALSSVLRHNRAALRGCRICVFLSEDAVAITQPMMDRLSDAYGLQIEVVSAHALGRTSTGFQKEYGSFTPGHRLSDAAYYRILALLWLGEQDNAGRAVYLDSDTCVGPGLMQLLCFDLAGRPLSARLEETTLSAIHRAATRLGVAPGQYFNSGVLALDLAHPACLPALRHAFEVAATEPERLSFHDQCALNLAFAGQVTPLPENFNSYVRHQDDVTTLPTNPLVTHYLARPKPWDPAYCSQAGARWLAEFYALGDVLEASQMRALLAMPFREARPES